MQGIIKQISYKDLAVTASTILGMLLKRIAYQRQNRLQLYKKTTCLKQVVFWSMENHPGKDKTLQNPPRTGRFWRLTWPQNTL